MVIGNGGKKLRDKQQRYQDSKNSISNGESVRTKWKNGGSWEYRQGKTKKQVEDSEKIISVLFICMVISIIGYTIVKFISNVI